MFCNQCGKEVEENDQYCSFCGIYLKQAASELQVSRQKYKYCKSCGKEVIGIYCDHCGSIAEQVTVANKRRGMANQQWKHGGSFFGQTKKDSQSSAKAKKWIVDKKEAAAWIKSGFIYSGIAVVLGMIISVLLGYGMRAVYLAEKVYGGSGWNDLYKNTFDTVVNFKLFAFNLIFGGRINWHFVVEDAADIHFSLALPLFGLIIGGMVLMISEKISLKITTQKRNLMGNVILSLICGIIFACVSWLLTESVKLSSDDLYRLGTGYLADYDLVKISTQADWLMTFENVAMISFFTLTFMMKTPSLVQNKIVLTIKHLIRLFFSLSFMLAAATIIKILVHKGEMPQGAEYLKILVCLIYLTGFILSIMLMGRFKLAEMIINSESVLQLKINLNKISYKYYGSSGEDENVIKIWMILLVVIVLLIVLAVAYRYWQEEKMDLSGAVVRSGGIGLGLGLALAVLSRISQFFVSMEMSVSSECQDSFSLDRSKYAYRVLSGNTSIIKTLAIVGIITFILFMLMYGLWMLHNEGIDHVIGFFNMKVICIIMAAFTVIFAIKLDLYSFNNGSLDQIENAREAVEDSFEGMIDDFLY